MQLAVEFISRMKEDKDSVMHKKFIGLVIQHVSAVNASVRTDDIWQTIKNGSCTYVTGKDEEDSNADEVFCPEDIEKMFKEEGLMTEVRDEISRCFESMAEAHSMVKDVYRSAGKLIPKLSTRGMGVLLEALTVGVPTIQVLVHSNAMLFIDTRFTLIWWLFFDYILTKWYSWFFI